MLKNLFNRAPSTLYRGKDSMLFDDGSFTYFGDDEGLTPEQQQAQAKRAQRALIQEYMEKEVMNPDTNWGDLRNYLRKIAPGFKDIRMVPADDFSDDTRYEAVWED